MTFARFSCLVCCLAASGMALGQGAVETSYSRVNTFALFGEYSNDSTHIILGDTVNRKIGAIGLEYQRRLVHRPFVDIAYTAEVRPAMIESDPTESVFSSLTSPFQSSSQGAPVAVPKCVAGSTTFSVTEPDGTVFAGKDVVTCGRRQVFAEGFAPVGFRFNFLTRHALQVTLSSHAGYIFSTQEVPVPGAGSFNFAFDFGGGLEMFRSHARSARLEYVVQHYSNKETGDINPGVDSGFLKVSYCFGR